MPYKMKGGQKTAENTGINRERKETVFHEQKERRIVYTYQNLMLHIKMSHMLNKCRFMYVNRNFHSFQARKSWREHSFPVENRHGPRHSLANSEPGERLPNNAHSHTHSLL